MRGFHDRRIPSKGRTAMSGALKLEFAPLTVPPKGVLIWFCEEGLKFGSAARRIVEPTGDLIARAAAAGRVKGKNGSALGIVAAAGRAVRGLLGVGVGEGGKGRDLKAQDFVKLGGTAIGKTPTAASEATIVADLPGGALKPDRIADLALGVQLRAYAFDRYKTKRKEGEEKPTQVKVA